ncbi:HHR054Wp [Eremothecium sinecaudum]|uniref:HHR054Wp n=1 Tax=Eremothecium sinecaudum TaxID=45286 RepID=A0A0X8HWQ4_9SACH|nr:HHR054Wp [Eremothecium sinecaudum]AMD22823.1 HHR054Wp [Eremothecium sinecaudum]
MDSDVSTTNGYEDDAAVNEEDSGDEYTLQEAQEDELYVDEEDVEYQDRDAEDEDRALPTSKRTSRAVRSKVSYDYTENDDDDFDDEEADQLEEMGEEEEEAEEDDEDDGNRIASVEDLDEIEVSPKKRKVSAIAFAGDDDDEEDDEEIVKEEKTISKVRSRSKMVLDLIDENNVRKRGQDSLTEEELQLRRAENARKRRNLSEKKLEEEKQDTINKLLKRRAGKSRSNLNQQEKDATDVDTSSFVKPRRPYQAQGMIRIIRNAQVELIAFAPSQSRSASGSTPPKGSESSYTSS